MDSNGDDEWWGLRRPGMKHEHKNEGFSNDDPIEDEYDESDSDDSDDDDDHGGQMMPIPGI